MFEQTGKSFTMTAAAGIVLAVTGCATMTAEECAVADWERIGEQDARAGHGMDYFARRASDCTEAGYSADQDAWTDGWDVGITWFCTRNNGFRKGLDGYRYEQICPGYLEAEFLDGYETGIAIHDLQSQVESTLSEIDQLEGRLKDLHEQESADRKKIANVRGRLDGLRDRLREQELELARMKGVAQGQGFPVAL